MSKDLKALARIKRELTSPYSEQNDVTEGKCETLWKFVGADTR